MSWMQQNVRVTDNQYVLLKFGGMRTDVHAFLSPALFAQTDETPLPQHGTHAAR